jgi:hypothetical protein
MSRLGLKILPAICALSSAKKLVHAQRQDAISDVPSTLLVLVGILRFVLHCGWKGLCKAAVYAAQMIASAAFCPHRRTTDVAPSDLQTLPSPFGGTHLP